MGTPRQRLEQKSVGNFTTDRYLATIPQPFLHRNLRLIHDRHEQELAAKPLGINSDTQDKVTDSWFSQAKAGSQLDAWNCQETSHLKAFIDRFDMSLTKRRINAGQTIISPHPDSLLQDKHDIPRATLVIKRLIIRRKDLRPGGEPDDSSDSDGDSGLGWMQRHKKHGKITKPATTCTVTLFKNTNKKPGTRITSQTRTGTMVMNNGVLHIIFENDFDVSFPTPDATPAAGPAVPGKFSVWMRVIIKNSCPTFTSLVLPDGSKSTTVLKYDTDQRTIISAHNYLVPTASSSSPFCKYESQALWEMDGNNKVEPQLRSELDVILAWRMRYRSTPLSSFNRAVDHMFESRQPQQLPTPNASEDLEQDRIDYQITYLFKQTRRLIRHDLSCPLCQKNVGVTSFIRLHLHLRLHHDCFTFTAEDNINEERSSKTCKIVHISLANEFLGKANIHGKGDILIDWVAPRKPFDQKEYLAGNSIWEEPVPRPPKTRSPKGKSRAKRPSLLPSESTFTRLPPEEVPDLIKRVRPVHPVPTVLGADGKQIRFFRTSSKRVLQPGEDVAESDEEVDDAWLIARQEQNLRRLKVLRGGKEQHLSDAEREFITDWNNHINEESKHSVNGDNLKRDGVIRFARLHRHKLKVLDWREQFQSKLRRLVKYNICDQDDMSYCLRPAADVTTEDGPRLPAATDANAIGAGIESLSMTTGTATNTKTTEQHGNQDETAHDTWDLCICGDRVFGKSGIMYCDNPQCSHDAFHMRCFDLKERPATWTCPDCTTLAGD